MPCPSSGVVRLLGLVAFAVSVPAVVLACSSDATSTGEGAPSATTTATTTAPSEPSPSSTTTAPPAPKDAGTDAAQVDAAPPPTDVADSPECKAYCAKMKSKCNSTCIPKSDCAIAAGQCAASTQDFLDCKTTQGSWYCGSGGFSIVSSCQRDTSLCK